MKINRGFTLIEVQISAMLMVVVLVATGVIFYFSLATIRYMQDAFSVYTNASTAMNLITNEVIRSNCYGSWTAPAHAQPVGSFYGANGYQQELSPGVFGLDAANSYNADMPTLGDSNAMNVCDMTVGTGLFLRQATQASFIRGDLSDVAGDFPSHEKVQIYGENYFDPEWTRNRLMIDRNDGNPPQAIADNLIQFDFQPIAYNCVHVLLTVEGMVDDPMAGVGVRRHRITLSKQITLRCAPSVTPIPGPTGTTW
ncbi:MAG: hypothetical protein KJ915_09735 [Candidatus Omnitrophica bacterium]|nr:hypothetical protein [Candidatus Omnitrophota bacterium]